MLEDVSKVVIDVGDQERAKVFWTQTMGFELVQDAPYQAEGNRFALEQTEPDAS